MPAKKKPTKPKRPIMSDLSRLDRVSDDQICYQDAPVPNLADWVHNARGFSGPPVKSSVTMKLDADVVNFFKCQGPGYQTRVNSVLRAYVDTKKGRRRRPGVR